MSIDKREPNKLFFSRKAYRGKLSATLIFNFVLSSVDRHTKLDSGMKEKATD